MGQEGRSRDPVERRIRRLASRQHGIAARWQLERLGVSPAEIRHRIDSGLLAQVHRGIYAVGHDALTAEAKWTAALLAVGADAVLSHRSAAALHGIAPDGVRPDVTVPRSSKRGPAICVHRATVPADERQSVKGIAVTDPSRTLLDLAAVVSLRELERAYREAHVLGLRVQIEPLLSRHPARRGVRKLRILLGEPVEKSRLERRFRRFLQRHALPLPDSINVRMPWGEADCVWWQQRVCVEVDGHSTHRTRAQFERDRFRDRRALTAGWHVVRVTSDQMSRATDSLARDLRAILQARSTLLR